MAELRGYLGQLAIFSDVWTPVANEVIGTGNGVTKSFYTAQPNVDYKGFAITLSDNVSDVAQVWQRDYSLTPAGRVTFQTAPAATIRAKADYRCSTGLLPAGGFTGWNLNVTADVLDTTKFGTNGWKTHIAGLAGWGGGAERHWIQGSDVVPMLGHELVVRFYTDEINSDYYTGWAIVNGVNPKSAVGVLVEEPLTFHGIDCLGHEDK